MEVSKASKNIHKPWKLSFTSKFLLYSSLLDRWPTVGWLKNLWCISSASRFTVCISYTGGPTVEKGIQPDLQHQIYFFKTQLDLTTPNQQKKLLHPGWYRHQQPQHLKQTYRWKKDTPPTPSNPIQPVEDLQVLERKGRAMIRLPPPPKVRGFRTCELAPLWALFHVGIGNRYGGMMMEFREISVSIEYFVERMRITSQISQEGCAFSLCGMSPLYL